MNSINYISCCMENTTTYTEENTFLDGKSTLECVLECILENWATALHQTMGFTYFLKRFSTTVSMVCNGCWENHRDLLKRMWLKFATTAGGFH